MLLLRFHLKECAFNSKPIRIHSVIGLPGLILLLLLLHEQSFCQISTGVIPDGTQGETMKIAEADTIVLPVTFENWNQFNNSLTTLRIGGGFLYEFAGYSQDETGQTANGLG